MKNIKRLLAMAILLGAQHVAAQTAAPLKLATKYEMPAMVKGRFDHLGIDMGGNRLFVVGEESQQVLVFDLATGKYIRSISVDHPHAVLYREDLQRIYITDEGKGVLNIYDGKTYSLLNSVALKVDTDSIGYDPATHYLYIDNGGDNAHEMFTMLSVVDTTAGTKLADIKVDGDTLEAMSLEKSGDRLFLNNPAKNEVEVIDRKTNKIATVWPVKLGKGNATMALDEPAHRLFVGCRSGAIVVFDTQTGKELQALTVGRGVDDLMFDPSSKRIYATSGGTGAVNVYKETDPDHYQSLGNVPSGPGAKTGLLVSQMSRLFVAVPPRGASPGEVYVYQIQ
ncbi:MAG TPA: YncE family protein [Candidatus Saccharimonadales bacterium]|jgi:DNA-binding beta-propeller fold protein YncE|nr:YncE family protein [Candidatus Saccharimonadales bacterium]